MIRGNQTADREFHILPLCLHSSFVSFYLSLFSFLYLFGVITNSVIIMLIYSINHLHTPMYFFICNLSVVDICYTTVPVPKLLYTCSTENNTISYGECFIQLFFYVLVASTEDVLTLIMAFDRYVAICNPLLYHSILNKKTCMFLIAVCWVVGCFNATIISISASNMTFCQSKTIRHFFCDGKALINVACTGLNQFYTVIYMDILTFGFCLFTCCLISYIKIIKVILQIKSKEGRSKAFSTCSSHLIVLIMYYTTGVSAYMVPKYSDVLEQVCSALYTVVTPMVNPLIYTLRNSEVKRALKKLI